MIRNQSGWSLARPSAHHARTIAAWPRSAAEATYWCSRAEHPFPASAITSWWEDDDVQPWILLDPEGAPVAYGEVWDDPEEDETELARLIVDPVRRREGVGRRLIEELLARVSAAGRSSCIIRLAPENDGALALYRTAGLRDIDEVTAAEWNQAQPARYRWLEHAGFPSRATDRERHLA